MHSIRVAQRLFRVLAVIGAAGSLSVGALAAGPAQAASSGQEFFVAGTDNCIETHGAGNQLTVEYAPNSTCAKITLYSRTDSNVYSMTDGNGNCLRANSSDVVLIEPTSCDQNDQGELWIVTAGDPTTCWTASSPCRLENEKQGLWLMVTGPAAGDKVWVSTGGKNDWVLQYPST